MLNITYYVKNISSNNYLKSFGTSISAYTTTPSLTPAYYGYRFLSAFYATLSFHLHSLKSFTDDDGLPSVVCLKNTVSSDDYEQVICRLLNLSAYNKEYFLFDQLYGL